MVAHGIAENSICKNKRQDGFYELKDKKQKYNFYWNGRKLIGTEITEISKPGNCRKFCYVNCS